MPDSCVECNGFLDSTDVGDTCYDCLADAAETAEPDDAELYLAYMREANEVADGSPESGPGDMTGWPTFEEWKAG